MLDQVSKRLFSAYRPNLKRPIWSPEKQQDSDGRQLIAQFNVIIGELEEQRFYWLRRSKEQGVRHDAPARFIMNHLVVEQSELNA